MIRFEIAKRKNLPISKAYKIVKNMEITFLSLHTSLSKYKPTDDTTIFIEHPKKKEATYLTSTSLFLSFLSDPAFLFTRRARRRATTRDEDENGSSAQRGCVTRERWISEKGRKNGARNGTGKKARLETDLRPRANQDLSLPLSRASAISADLPPRGVCFRAIVSSTRVGANVIVGISEVVAAVVRA